MPLITETTSWLRAGGVMHNGVGVDRDRQVLRGYVMAQQGPFKTQGRGEFDESALRKIVALANKNHPNGLKCRLSHPTLSSDGLGKFLGRVKHPRMDSVRVMRDGKPQLMSAVRGDLHLDKTAMDEPVGGGKPIGEYVMDLAESDPDALSSSLVLEADQERRFDARRMPLKGADGEELPPLWRPTRLHASDVVDTGEACDGILSASFSGLPDAIVRQAAQLLNKQFPNASRRVVRARCLAWLDSYLAHRFGDQEGPSGIGPSEREHDEEEGREDETQLECMAPGCNKLATNHYCDDHVVTDYGMTGKQEQSHHENGHGTSRGVAEMQTYLARKRAGLEKLSTIPRADQHSPAVEGEWSAPNLGDFTSESWDDLSDGEKSAIETYYAAKTGGGKFSDLKLPHHFAKGPNKGKASLNGVRNALARLNQTQGIDKAKAHAHLQSHMPKESKEE